MFGDAAGKKPHPAADVEEIELQPIGQQSLTPDKLLRHARQRRLPAFVQRPVRLLPANSRAAKYRNFVIPRDDLLFINEPLTSSVLVEYCSPGGDGQEVRRLR